MRRRFGSRSVGVLLSLVLACATLPALASDTISVEVGRESAMVSFDAMFPAVTYIHVGDTITFTSKASDTPHTVTFAASAQMPSITDRRENVTAVLDRLEVGGFLRRQRDREDRRLVRLAVKNKAVVKEMRRAFNQYVAELRQTWSAAECRSVQSACEKLSSVL